MKDKILRILTRELIRADGKNEMAKFEAEGKDPTEMVCLSGKKRHEVLAEHEAKCVELAACMEWLSHLK